MKKIFATATFIGLCFLLCACSKILPGKDISEKIYLHYADMKSYSAEIKITAYSNKNKNVYDALQYYKFPDKMRSETKDVITIIDGQTATVKNAHNASPLQISQLQSGNCDFMFLQNFFSAYYNGETSSAHMSGENGDMAVLCVETGLDNPYRSEVQLTVNTKNLQPVFLELKSDGEVFMHIDYINFKINDEINDELFHL